MGSLSSIERHEGIEHSPPTLQTRADNDTTAIASPRRSAASDSTGAIRRGGLPITAVAVGNRRAGAHSPRGAQRNECYVALQRLVVYPSKIFADS